jgi:hypothetical protein
MGEVKASIIWKGDFARGEALLAAICPDDPDDFSVQLRKDGDRAQLRVVVSSEGLGRSRASVDDILACLAAAESGLDSLG